ncbi:WAT1-related protein [Canna indica]|uniref:WAT1-related protein n=1 Tax=Canna indica TaxID=4628 RepID=A0AAQ3QJ05_9LILI|nr:WAT1-related protein [Canna indica]
MDACKPYIASILIQLTYTGFYVISKAAFDKGVSTYVFIFYRQATASVLLAPIAMIFERKNSPPLTCAIALKLFLHALLGITWSLNLYNIGLKYTSASVASAATNSVPVFTFFLALLLGLETIKMKSLSGISKALGVTLCLIGVLTIAFYRGPHIHPLSLHGHFGHSINYKANTPPPSMATWIKGSFFVISANITWSLWIVLQGKLLKEYPSKLLFTTIQCLFSTFQSLLVAMAFERDASKWRLHLDMGLVAILYCGFVVTGVSFYLQSWCIEKKGPVFMAIFTPLAFVFTMICSTIFLGEMIYLGSVIGGVLMVGGLYGVLWGKIRENMHCDVSIEDGEACMQEKETTRVQSI